MSEEIQETKKIGFFKKVLKSIKDFDKYEDFALESLSDTLKYLLKIMIIFAIIIAAVYTYKVLTGANNIYIGLKDKIPEFNYENGILSVDSDEIITIDDYKDTIGTIVIDTKTESGNIKEYMDQNSDKGIKILFLKDGFTISNLSINGQTSYKYNDLLSTYNITSGTKNDLINYIDNLNIIYIFASVFLILFVYLFFIYLITITTDVLLLSFVAYLSSRIFRIKLKFGVSFNIAVHAITLPIILNLIYIIINLFTRFEIKYFQIMYYTISYIYIVVAILMIKTDFINRQAELIKIANEQMKVKEELEKENEKEDNNQKDKDETKKEDKKEEDEDVKKLPNNKEKTKNKEKKSDDEPIGDASITEK